MLDLSKFDNKGLDTLYEVHENLCENLFKTLQEKKNPETDDHREQLIKFGNLLNQLQIIKDEINRRKKENLVYSIEDVYKFAGQYDKYAIFSFYKTSDAYKKYGDDAYGYLIYKLKEREALESIIKNSEYERTDEKIYLKGASSNAIKNELLKSEGFLASDVLEVLVSNNLFTGKQYKKEGQKEIPHTITVKFDPSGFDLEKTQVWLASRKIADGHTLLPHDYVELYCNLFVLEPDSVSEANKEKYLLTADKSGFNRDAEIKILAAKLRRMIISPEEIARFSLLLKQRRLERFEVVKRELGVSHKSIGIFRDQYPDRYKDLVSTILRFETETLSEYKTQYPIYWDFDRFIHIYLRHYSDFFIEPSTVKGTKFQYTYKDIRRVACLIIESLKEEIEACLSKGRRFSKYDDKGFYFNGNFYTIRIDENGRLMQLHPL